MVASLHPPLTTFRFLTAALLGVAALPSCSDRAADTPTSLSQALAGDPVSWAQRQKVDLPNVTAGSHFGERIALSGDTLIVGAPTDSQVAPSAGAAFVLVRRSTGWVFQQKLVVTGSAAGDALGASVAIDGDTAVVGAWGVDSTWVDTGAAYVFTRSAGIWTQRAKLVSSDAEEQDHFGVSSVVSGTNIVVSAPGKRGTTQFNIGASYAFTGSGAMWQQTGKLMPTAGANDLMGSALALSGTTLAMGTDRQRGYSVAYFTLQNGTWGRGPASTSSTNAAFAHYGSRLALSKAYTVIGGYQDDGDTATPPGSVLVVDNATPSKQWTVTASDPAPNDQFGSAVAISDTGTLLVGSQRDDDQGNDSGSVYVFELANGAWVQRQKLTATDGAASARFGAALAISGTSALVSAPLSANGSGSTYWFANGWVNGSGCTDGAGCATGLCIENVCCDTACDGLCRSCLGVNTGAPSGTCAAILAASDPYQECADTGAGTCGTNGLCDGAGACAKYAPGTPCTNSACVTPSIAPVESACDPAGTCSPTSTMACAVGFQCRAGACSSTCTSNADCDVASGYSCTAFKLCQLPLGAACTSDGPCESGACQNAQCCTPGPTGVCPAPLGGSCNIDIECAVGTCQAGVCSVMMGTGGGSSAGGGSGGSSSAGASAGGSAGNGLAGALASGGSGAVSAGEAGAGEPPKSGIGLACVTHSDCPAELGCDPTSNTCQDRIVTSCGCRAVGARPNQPAWAWLIVASTLLAARRRRFKASAEPSPVD